MIYLTMTKQHFSKVENSSDRIDAREHTCGPESMVQIQVTLSVYACFLSLETFTTYVQKKKTGAIYMWHSHSPPFLQNSKALFMSSVALWFMFPQTAMRW